MAKLLDLLGKTFGKLIVLRKGKRKLHPSGKTSTTWIVICSCSPSIEHEVIGSSLRSGSTKSCGCFKNESTSNRQFRDIEGQRFGRLLVTKLVGHDSKGSCLWEARGDCGNSIVRTGTILRKYVKSCGCLKSDSVSSPLLGKRFERLVVVSRTGSVGRSASWMCKCDCGIELPCSSNQLSKGYARSCGCLNKEVRRGGITPTRVLQNQILASYKTGATRRKLEWGITLE